METELRKQIEVLELENRWWRRRCDDLLGAPDPSGYWKNRATIAEQEIEALRSRWSSSFHQACIRG